MRNLGNHHRVAGHMRWVAIALWSALAVVSKGDQEKPPGEKQPAARHDSVRETEPPKDVSAPPPNAIKVSSGIAMEKLKPGSGNEYPRGDDCAVIRFTAWKRDGSLFSSSGLQGASTVQCLFTAIPGIAEALKLMTAGEKRRIWVPADMAFAAHVAHHGNKHVDADPVPEVDLTIDLELIRIMRAPTRPADLEKPPPTALRMQSGLAIQVLQQGHGTKHPSLSSNVTLNFSGWTADGRLIESTVTSGHPAVFLLGTVIPGWREALTNMLAGEKARIWIPAALAYGIHPLDGMTPAGDLVYDIELLNFN